MWTLLVRYKQRPAPQNDTRGVPSGGTSPPDPRLAARARRGASSAATERRAAAIGGPLQRAAARPAAALSMSVDLPRDGTCRDTVSELAAGAMRAASHAMGGVMHARGMATRMRKTPSKGSSGGRARREARRR